MKHETTENCWTRFTVLPFIYLLRQRYLFDICDVTATVLETKAMSESKREFLPLRNLQSGGGGREVIM